MSLTVTPGRIRAAVSLVEATADVVGAQPVAALSYVRLRAAVLVVGQVLQASLVDPAVARDALSISFAKSLADSSQAYGSFLMTLFHGNELNGAELNAAELNG
jgi:hypothetical protein